MRLQVLPQGGDDQPSHKQRSCEASRHLKCKANEVVALVDSHDNHVLLRPHAVADGSEAKSHPHPARLLHPRPPRHTHTHKPSARAQVHGHDIPHCVKLSPISITSVARAPCTRNRKPDNNTCTHQLHTAPDALLVKLRHGQEGDQAHSGRHRGDERREEGTPHASEGGQGGDNVNQLEQKWVVLPRCIAAAPEPGPGGQART